MYIVSVVADGMGCGALGRVSLLLSYDLASLSSNDSGILELKATRGRDSMLGVFLAGLAY